MGLLYTNFINSLDLKLELKNKLIKDLHNNWICDEWILSFIDAGRILESTTHVMTTNNYTERLNRTIESQYSGNKTVVNFIERLYGIKLLRENLTNECGQVNFEAGLATVFDMQTIEQVLYNNIMYDFIITFIYLFIHFDRKHKLLILRQIDCAV